MQELKDFLKVIFACYLSLFTLYVSHFETTFLSSKMPLSFKSIFFGSYILLFDSLQIKSYNIELYQILTPPSYRSRTQNHENSQTTVQK